MLIRKIELYLPWNVKGKSHSEQICGVLLENGVNVSQRFQIGEVILPFLQPDGKGDFISAVKNSHAFKISDSYGTDQTGENLVKL